MFVLQSQLQVIIEREVAILSLWPGDSVSESSKCPYKNCGRVETLENLAFDLLGVAATRIKDSSLLKKLVVNQM